MKFIQIAATEIPTDDEPTGTLYALADDGSVWFMVDPWLSNARWRKLPVITVIENEKIK
jgi:hypothetical protein